MDQEMRRIRREQSRNERQSRALTNEQLRREQEVRQNLLAHNRPAMVEAQTAILAAKQKQQVMIMGNIRATTEIETHYHSIKQSANLNQTIQTHNKAMRQIHDNKDPSKLQKELHEFSDSVIKQDLVTDSTNRVLSDMHETSVVTEDADDILTRLKRESGLPDQDQGEEEKKKKAEEPEDPEMAEIRLRIAHI